ncbi:MULTISPECIES: sensor histidine kinase [unclassified Sphingomonas]|nr:MULTISPECIES: sensor histidine kinase [unclassified Sphingomonas]
MNDSDPGPNAKASPPYTIRRRLLLWLLPPLCIVLAIGVALDYHNGMAPLRRAYDHTLANATNDIAAAIEGKGDLADARARRILASLDVGLADYRSYYRLRSVANGEMAGQADLPEASITAPVSFADTFYRGQKLRIASRRIDTGAGPVIVTVAETTQKHDAASWRIVGSLLLTDVLQLGATILFVWLGVRQGLRPLSRLREDISQRSPSTLEPLDPATVPEEVQPIVAELNRLFATVRESALSQQRFLADAAHQIRTPLAGLRARVELMHRKTAVDAQHRDLEVLLSSIDRLSHTAHQLLALARADPSARASIDFVPVDLLSLTADVVEHQFDHALARRIDLGLDAVPISVTGSPWMLRELLLNLVDNALRYTPEGGQVTVRCGAQGEGVFLAVEDDGPGIPVAERAHVCNRFYRMPGSPGSGCGLGLSIVAEVARLHMADLQIGDGLSGRGTRVKVLFGGG